VSGPESDPRQSLDGKGPSRRDFVKLSLAASCGLIAAAWVGSKPQTYRIAVLGADSYGHKILEPLLRKQKTGIVSLSENHEQSDLIVIAASDLSDTRLVNVAMSSASSVLIVTPVCHSIDSLAEIKAARLRKGRFVHIGAEKRLVPELISLCEIVKDQLCESNWMLNAERTEPARHQQRVLSGWAVWIDPLA
jgi:hypothetical protein